MRTAGAAEGLELFLYVHKLYRALEKGYENVGHYVEEVVVSVLIGLGAGKLENTEVAGVYVLEDGLCTLDEIL